MIRECPVCNHTGELTWCDGKYHCAVCNSEVPENEPPIFSPNETTPNNVTCPICKNKENNLFDGAKYRCALCGTPFECGQHDLTPSCGESSSSAIDLHTQTRPGMKVGMIICFVLAGIYALIAFVVPMVLFMTVFCGVLGAMFLLLSITPKESKYLFGKPNGLRKWLFVLLAILLAFILSVVVLEGLAPSTDSNDISQPQSVSNVGVRIITFSDKFTAEYVLAKWESGDRSEKSLITLMDKYGSQQGGGQLYIVFPGEFVEEIDDWIFSPNRKNGDYAIIENDYGYSFCYFSGWDYNEEDYK